jgi:hypothetical protein
LNPQKSVDLRLSSGSPSIHEQQKLFSFAVEGKKKYEEQVLGREKHLASSFAHFRGIIEKYEMRN